MYVFVLNFQFFVKFSFDENAYELFLEIFINKTLK